MRFNELTIFNPTIPTWDCVSLRVHRTSETIRRKDLQREMNEQFELITVTISLAAAEMNENNCRTAIGKPAFSGVMQSMTPLEKLPTSQPLTHVSFLKPPVREKQELRWVVRDPETVNNSTRSRFCLFVSRLSHYSDPLIMWWDYSLAVCVGDGHG